MHIVTPENTATQPVPKGTGHLGAGEGHRWGQGLVGNELEISPDSAGKRVCFNRSYPDAEDTELSDGWGPAEPKPSFRDPECSQEALVWLGVGACVSFGGSIGFLPWDAAESSDPLLELQRHLLENWKFHSWLMTLVDTLRRRLKTAGDSLRQFQCFSFRPEEEVSALRQRERVPPWSLRILRTALWNMGKERSSSFFWELVVSAANDAARPVPC